MNEIDIQLVTQWFNEARTKLEKSNKICSDSNQQSNSIIQNINEILATNRYQFLIDSISQQLRLLDIIRSSLETLVENYNKEFDEEVSDNTFGQLTQILSQLKSIKTTKSRTLYDFINHEEIESTKDNFFILRKTIEEDRTGLSAKELSETLREFQEEFSKMLDTNSLELITTNVDPILLENNELEQDMAQALDNLTKHFDQTSRSMEFFQDTKIPTSSKIELYKVLQNDSSELPEVMEELVQTNNQFLTNCEKISDHISKFRKDEESLITFFETVKVYGETLQSTFIVNFNETHNKLVELLLEFNSLKDNLTELSRYYKQFVSSFESLKTELKRRQQVNDKLKTLIGEFKNNVQQIETAERSYRETFLIENGEFLPKNILDEGNDENSNVLYNALPNIEVLFQAERIPKI